MAHGMAGYEMPVSVVIRQCQLGADESCINTESIRDVIRGAGFYTEVVASGPMNIHIVARRERNNISDPPVVAFHYHNGEPYHWHLGFSESVEPEKRALIENRLKALPI